MFEYYGDMLQDQELNTIQTLSRNPGLDTTILVGG